MAEQYHTGTFERLPAEKQERVLSIAKHAFAEGGFAATSVNAIAAAAGISIGTLYKYFRSKEDLFLAIIGQGHDLLQVVLEAIVSSPSPLLAKIELLLNAAVSYSEKDPDFVKIYIDCTTQGLAPLASRLSRSIESIAADAYGRLLKDAQARGEIDPGLDTSVAAFCLDNLLLMLQYSFGCGYYRERLALFAGNPALSDPRTVIRGTMRFIENALGCASAAPA